MKTQKKGCSLCLALVCTLSSVSSLLAGPQRLQYHHNVEQSPEFPEVSDIWLKIKTFNGILVTHIEMFLGNSVQQMLTCLLLPCCQIFLEEWTEDSTLWQRKPED